MLGFLSARTTGRARKLAVAGMTVGSLLLTTSPLAAHALPVLNNTGCEIVGGLNDIQAPTCGPISPASTYTLYVGWVPGSLGTVTVTIGGSSNFLAVCNQITNPCTVSGSGAGAVAFNGTTLPTLSPSPHCRLATLGCPYNLQVRFTTTAASSPVQFVVYGPIVGDFYLDVSP